VARDADAATIRSAYRRRAREHHPDRVQSARAGAGADEMAAINEAYRVLGDPARRAAYDHASSSAASNSATRPTAEATTTPPGGWSYVDRTPARIPWRLMATFAIVGTIAVLVGAMFVDPPDEQSPDGILRSGSCVSIEANGDAREVACSGGDELVVEQLVPIGARCPGGTRPYRDRLGLGTACVVGPD
jgi:DnaJ domain